VKKVLKICKHNQRGIENSKDSILLSTAIPTAHKCTPLVTAMCLYLHRTYVRQTCAQTNKDITISKPVSVSPCWLYSAIFVTCVRNDCNHSLSISFCRLVTFRSCDYFSEQSLAKWRRRIHIWNEIFHFKNRISGNDKYTEDYTTSLYIRILNSFVWYGNIPVFIANIFARRNILSFFEKNTILIIIYFLLLVNLTRFSFS